MDPVESLIYLRLLSRQRINGTDLPIGELGYTQCAYIVAVLRYL